MTRGEDSGERLGGATKRTFCQAEGGKLLSRGWDTQPRAESGDVPGRRVRGGAWGPVASRGSAAGAGGRVHPVCSHHPASGVARAFNQAPRSLCGHRSISRSPEARSPRRRGSSVTKPGTGKRIRVIGTRVGWHSGTLPKATFPGETQGRGNSNRTHAGVSGDSTWKLAFGYL